MKSLYSYSAILLTLIFSTGLIYQTLTVVNFYFNRAEITEKYCVNKEKPEKKCHGKCHLEKQLTVSTANESPDAQATIQSITFWLFGVEILKELRLETFQVNSKKTDDLFVKATANADTSMFVPPDFS
ncbi:MAG: hypothetical protein IPG07_14110 [Crocinitomicaceae bacterium]|nr:hypothetical protein [Crocinitomicaceae bacterium]